MSKANALREQAIGSFLAAEALLDGDQPRDQAAFEAHMTTGRRLMAEFRAESARDGGASSSDANDPDGLRAILHDMTSRGGQSALPLPGGSGSTSWGQSFIDERIRRSGFSSGGFNAALLEAGSVAVSVPMRTTPILDARRARFIFQLISEEPAPAGQFGYLKETARDLNAAVVAPGAKKPVSTFGLVRVNDTTKVIAHVTEPINRFDVEDAPLLRTFIDTELRYGCDLALDDRVVASLLAEATEGEATVNLLGIRTAITTLQLIEMDPDGIAINPTDWQTVEQEAVTTFAANSNAPAATEALDRRLYGVPVVVSNSIPEGAALVGDFRDSAQLYVTGGVRIDVSDSTPREVEAETVSDFQLNQLVFRGERRAEVAVGRPAGFVLVGNAGS